MDAKAKDSIEHFEATHAHTEGGDDHELRTLVRTAAVLVAVLAIALGRILAARLGTWNATIAAVGAYLLVVLIGGALLPVVDETPADFPATVLYDFRIASLGLHLVLWTALGLVFGALAERGVRREQQVLAGR